jgi:tetratricopeptide (TPR) repeat protein
VLLSLIFLLALAGVRLWDLYEDVLAFDPSIRQLVLRVDKTDPPNRRPRRRAPDASTELVSALGKMTEFHDRGSFREFNRIYPRTIDLLNKFGRGKGVYPYARNEVALLANNVAWRLATSREPRARSATRAIALAKRAVELEPEDGNAWNTLAVAYYRDGDLDDADEAFTRSMNLREGGDSFDWFFLAMMRAEDGDDAEARRYYDRAVAWMKEFRAADPELHRFRIEAADFLAIDDPDAYKPLLLPMRRPGDIRPRIASPD